MSYIAGKQKKLVTRGLIYAIDGIDHGTFPGNGSSSTTYGDLVGQNDATLYNKTTHRYHKQGILSYTGNESTSDYVTIPGSVASAISGGSFSIGIWVRLNNATTTSGGGGGTEPIIAFNNGTSARTCLSISRTGTTGAGTTSGEDERLGMFFFGDDLVASTTQVSTIMGTKWTYVVGTFNSSGNTQTLYINGSQHSTRTSSGAPNIGSTTGNIGRNDIYTRLGGSYTESDNPKLDGQTGPVHIYDRTLSAAEVLENYNVWKLRFQDSSGDGTDNGQTDDGGSIVQDSLALDYDFGSPICNPGSGTTITDLQGSNNGTISNATYSKINGGVLDFNGSDAKITLPTAVADFFSQQSFSVGLWIKLDNSTRADMDPFFSVYAASSSNRYFKIQRNQNDHGNNEAEKLQMNFYGDDLNNQGTVFTSTDWTYFVGTFDNSTKLQSIYTNGTLYQSRTASSNTNVSGGSVYIGADDAALGSRFLDGKVAMCHIYDNKALTAAEVLQNYNATKSRFGL